MSLKTLHRIAGHCLADHTQNGPDASTYGCQRLTQQSLCLQAHESLSQQLRSLSDRHQALLQHQAASLTHDSEVSRLRSELSKSQSEVAVVAGQLAAAQQTCRSAAGQPYSVCNKGHSVCTRNIISHPAAPIFLCSCICRLYKLRQHKTFPDFV